MRLRVLGSSGSHAARGNPGSSYLLTSGSTAVLLDSGPGSFLALADVMAPEEVTGVVISHIHADHCSDLFALYGYLDHRGAGAAGSPVPVWLPRGAVAPMAAFMRAGPDHGFFRVFDFLELEDGSAAEIGMLALRFAATNHPVPTLAVRVEAEGRSLTYSADTGPGAGLAELADGTDVLLCEATLPGTRTTTSYPYHLTGREAGALGAAAGAGRLIVTHVPPTLDAAVIAADAGAAFGKDTDVAQPGMTIDI